MRFLNEWCFTLILVLVAVGCVTTQDPPILRIIGGLPANDIQIPYIVSLVTFGYHTCGGSIINKRTILTAAHCLQFIRPRLLRVHAGAKSRALDEGVFIPVDSIIMHENYDAKSMDYDVGLIRLAKPLNFSSSIQPVALSTTAQDPELPDGIYGTISGYGVTRSGGSGSYVLRYARVPIVERQKCAQLLKKNVTERMICAGYPRGGVDACQLDSGGPLVVRQKLVGVVSWGVGCGLANKPGVYALVSEFYPWIVEKLKTFGENLQENN